MSARRRARLRRRGAVALVLVGVLGGCRSAPGGALGSALLTPTAAALERPAPDSFVVAFTTSRGLFEVLVRRHWAPRGADRLHYLVNAGYYNGLRFFRVVGGFMAQFGIHGDTAINAAWRTRRIPDDSVRTSNTRGTVTFATAGPNTRTTQLFINFADNRRLDPMGFAPLGTVITGMSVVDSLHAGYGEGAPRGGGPDQGRMQREGNAYLAFGFPRLDTIVAARVSRRWP